LRSAIEKIEHFLPESRRAGNSQITNIYQIPNFNNSNPALKKLRAGFFIFLDSVLNFHYLPTIRSIVFTSQLILNSDDKYAFAQQQAILP
jgi:hypothetical protein